MSSRYSCAFDRDRPRGFRADLVALSCVAVTRIAFKLRAQACRRNAPAAALQALVGHRARNSRTATPIRACSQADAVWPQGLEIDSVSARAYFAKATADLAVTM